MMQLIPFLFAGVVAGICSGIFGIGGGVVLVPILVAVLGFTQHTANGISLVALLLPVGILGAFEYYREGRIGPEQIKIGLLIALGIIAGTFVGAKAANLASDSVLRRAFSVLLAAVAIHLWFIKKS
jgi:uncharacterized membrane protein YfcA